MNLSQVITVYNLAAMGEPYYGDYKYPAWAVMIGWCIAVSSLIPIPVCFVLELLRHEGSLIEVSVLIVVDVRAGSGAACNVTALLLSTYSHVVLDHPRA